ncbi:Soluble guanylate cyclase gcy [Paragonimus skrjabini miyazakii]|uniref:Soluble guanylate cyclase gcy n=1 Tax=Paragonimus skrjabini miyazakii TaxID=59628 RepID=A0A8S9YP23_9TREM|nr:Soluble guanylate cyclase gcy [Paragonimus skrjabini miyazakii]
MFRGTSFLTGISRMLRSSTYSKMFVVRHRLPSMCLRKVLGRNYRAESITYSELSDSQPYTIPCAWQGPDQLAEFLYKRIVATTEHFVVLDKPAGLSVWGHSLSKREALAFMQLEPDSSSSGLSVHQCLPQLARLLHRNLPSSCSAPTTSELSLSEGVSGSTTKLSIIEPLPAAYSGLIVLGRTPQFAQVAQTFYTNAQTSNPPWQLYQQFLAVCWNKPFREHANNVRFPIATYVVNEHVRVGYRPPPGEITRKSERFGNVLHKYISHRSITPTTGDASIIELRLNSTYRGLPEVYLLHEGCGIVGELFQSSRLVDTGLSPVVLPPAKIQFNRSHPLRIRRRLGVLDNRIIPVHLHRTSVFLPTPVRVRPCSTDCMQYRSTVQSPVSFKKMSRTLSNNFDYSNLSWTKLSKWSDPESSNCLVLTCSCPSLPSYFAHTMQRLSVNFDYSSWLASQKT